MAELAGRIPKQPPKKKTGQGIGPRTINGAALDVRGTSAFLGWNEKKTRAMVARRLIPFRRLGGRIVFLRKDLEAFVNALPGCSLEAALQNEAQRCQRRAP